MSGRSTPRGSPSYRKVNSGRASRRERAVHGRFHWIRGNRLVFLLILITLWAYIGFAVQSKWAHDAHGKEFVDKTTSRRVDDVDGVGVSSGGGKMLLEKIGWRRSRNPRPNLSRKAKKNSQILRNTSGNAEDEDDDRIIRGNSSYGTVVGPFGKIEDSILEWNAQKRRGSCDRKGRFASLVWSRSFLLIFHELSMTGAPLTMMELATELLSCGASVTVIALSRQGGLMPELNRRGIRVFNDKGESSFKMAMKRDLVIAGSAVCSSWIDQYLDFYGPGSSQIVWWIMENRREYFNRSKKLLDQVKTVLFLSESQSTQWLTWCKEEGIRLKSEPTVIPLSITDELAFVAGMPSSLNSPSFTVERMEEKRRLLRQTARREMGLNDGDVLVMTLSSINPGKGQLLLLESVLLMQNQSTVPQLDIKIGSLFEGKNISDVILETHLNQTQVPEGLRRNITYIPMPQKKRRRRSRSKSLGRRLLEVRDGVREPSLKVLIGSVGSKSNKIAYVKGILKLLSQNRNLSQSVLWTPATTRVPALYSAADIYVMNAQGLGETFGRVTVEAMAFGLPVLGTEAGGTKEIVEDKVTGLLHPLGRDGEDALAQNLRFLLRDAAAREQLGLNGRLRVAQSYLKRHMYSKLAIILAKCMKPK
ncbi:uncharacterized protein LOC144703854 isoform X2 [Wolffia australiana]